MNILNDGNLKNVVDNQIARYDNQQNAHDAGNLLMNGTTYTADAGISVTVNPLIFIGSAAFALLTVSMPEISMAGFSDNAPLW